VEAVIVGGVLRADREIQSPCVNLYTLKKFNDSAVVIGIAGNQATLHRCIITAV
jgi:hypothetical protein